jgi:hypothetical protein
MLTEAIARELMPLDELPVVAYRLIFDGGNGLALQVLPSGDKRWVWQGRDGPKGRMVRLSLGQWARGGLTVRQARRLAAEVRSRVRAGEDIATLRRELKARGRLDTSRTPPP